MNSQLAAHQDLAHAPVRLLADPAVAGIDLHLAPRAFGHAVIHCAAGVNDLDARRRGQQARGHRGAERIFHVAQVADDSDLEFGDWRLEIGAMRKRPDRLINRARLAVQMRRQIVESLGLQHDDPRGQFKRFLRAFAAFEIAVEIGSGQRDDQWLAGALAMEAFDGVVTLLCVQGDEQVEAFAFVSLREADAAAEVSQNPRPAKRRDAVAIARSRRRGRDDPNLHIAHVLNPAHTSRRSGW